MTAPVAKVGRPITQPCGTVAAYKRHGRRGEPSCAACRAAWATEQRRLYLARKLRSPFPGHVCLTLGGDPYYDRFMDAADCPRCEARSVAMRVPGSDRSNNND